MNEFINNLSFEDGKNYKTFLNVSVQYSYGKDFTKGKIFYLQVLDKKYRDIKHKSFKTLPSLKKWAVNNLIF